MSGEEIGCKFVRTKEGWGCRQTKHQKDIAEECQRVRQKSGRWRCQKKKNVTDSSGLSELMSMFHDLKIDKRNKKPDKTTTETLSLNVISSAKRRGARKKPSINGYNACWINAAVYAFVAHPPILHIFRESGRSPEFQTLGQQVAPMAQDVQLWNDTEYAKVSNRLFYLGHMDVPRVIQLHDLKIDKRNPKTAKSREKRRLTLQIQNESQEKKTVVFSLPGKRLEYSGEDLASAIQNMLRKQFPNATVVYLSENTHFEIELREARTRFRILPTGLAKYIGFTNDADASFEIKKESDSFFYLGVPRLGIFYDAHITSIELFRSMGEIKLGLEANNKNLPWRYRYSFSAGMRATLTKKKGYELCSFENKLPEDDDTKEGSTIWSLIVGEKCTPYGGVGHFIAYVKDPNTRMYYKFDAVKGGLTMEGKTYAELKKILVCEEKSEKRFVIALYGPVDMYHSF